MKNDGIELYQGDCLEVMDKLIEEGVTVDAIITDPPYGTTQCSWDNVIPFNDHVVVEGKTMTRDEFILFEVKKGKSYQEALEYFNKNSKEGMWQKLIKLIKPNGAIVLFGSEPFSTTLRMSNLKMFKYDWIYQKNKTTGFLNAKKMPLNDHEIISIFYQKPPTYNPQKTKATKIYKRGFVNRSTDVYGDEKPFQQTDDGLRYPTRIQYFNNNNTKDVFHPTQKPIELMKYLIKTYTNQGEVVLDFTMGSGSTGVAAKQLDRDFIGIELDREFFNISKERIDQTVRGSGLKTEKRKTTLF